MGDVHERVDVRRGPGTCPFCHDEIARADDIVVCRDCNARHHAPCWSEPGGVCATCASTVGLGALVASSPVERIERVERPAADAAPVEDPAGRVQLGGLIADLRLHRDSCMFRQWWLFLVPHMYIPPFWPILYLNLVGERRKVAALVEKARVVVGAHRLKLSKDEQLVLAESKDWSERPLL